jgi:hypothetical protein
VVGGGAGNVVGIGARGAVIGGGEQNAVGSGAEGVEIAGGTGNVIRSNAHHTSIGGGLHNTATDAFATVPAGLDNMAGAYGFAAGRRAKAVHSGSFVWGDSSDREIASPWEDSVTFRASGGVRFYTDPDATAGVVLPAGGTGWSVLSDRNMKENCQAIDAREVLEQVASLPIQAWNLKTQDSSTRHVGPMAQDFHAAFGLGEDERHINSVDADGVALAAIQGLYEVVRDQAAALQARDMQLATHQRQIADLLSRIDALEASLSGTSVK